jgi:CO dehydrogenase/acetyl-CoA synthase gamma subunit (corrinoid Fe-S protein)
MKQFLLIFFSILLIAGCNNQKVRKDSSVDIEAEKEKVSLVLEKYVIANEKQDIEMVHDIWAPESDIVVFGTNSDEKLIGWDAIKAAMERQFNSFEDTYISIHDQIIHVDEMGKTAWFSEIVNYNYIYQGENMQYEGLRFTGVLKKFDNDWLIVQSHMSIPASAN